MPSLYETVKKFPGDNKLIIQCDSSSVLKSKSYKEVIYMSNVIYNELITIFTNQIGYIGLLMDYNVYLPSIIIR